MLQGLEDRVLSFGVIGHLLLEVCEDLLLLVDVSGVQGTLVVGGFEACLR